MKNTCKVLLFVLLIPGFSCVVQRPMPDLQQQPVSEQQGYVNFQVFYDNLSSYGQWVNNPDYGYVWIPDAGPDFVPYSTAGHWVMTDFGWMWLSNYEWGWAPFHYGRWDYNDYLGWFWIPGHEWGPAWVVWRRGGGYYGWAPMRPGITVEMSFRSEYNDVNRWNFVRDRDFDRDDLGRYYIDRRDNDRIIRNSTVINNTYIDNNRRETYIAGPRPNEIQAATGRRIQSVAVRDNDRPGQKFNSQEVQLYRPRVESANETRTKTAPSRVVDQKDVRPPAERNNFNRQNNVQTQPQLKEQQQVQQNPQTEEIRRREELQNKNHQQVQQNQQTEEMKRRQLQNEKVQQAQHQQVQQQQVQQQKQVQNKNLNQKQPTRQELRAQKKQIKQQNKAKTNPPDKKDKKDENEK